MTDNLEGGGAPPAPDGGAPQTPGGGNAMVDRIKRILIEPKAEWPKIDAEPMTVGEIFKGWVIPLAAIPAVASFIGMVLFGFSVLGVTVRFGLVQALSSAIMTYVLSLIGVFVISLIIDALAPTFGGTKNQVQATKVAAFSYTAAWVAGILNILPALGMLAALLGLYSLYLLYLGLPKLMRTPEDKALPYVASVIVAAIVLSIVVALVAGSVTSMFAPRSMIPDTQLSGTINVPGAGSLDLGKLEEASRKMETAAKRMEPGTARPALAPATLQGLLPETLGSYRRVEVSSASAGAGGLGGASAEARYEDGQNQFELQVSDIAAAGVVAAMGSALNVETNRQTATGYERTGKIGGRMTMEKWDTASGRGEYGVMVADRFMVQASGKVPNMDVLKGAVNAVGLVRLESLAG